MQTQTSNSYSWIYIWNIDTFSQMWMKYQDWKYLCWWNWDAVRRWASGDLDDKLWRLPLNPVLKRPFRGLRAFTTLGCVHISSKTLGATYVKPWMHFIKFNFIILMINSNMMYLQYILYSLEKSYLQIHLRYFQLENRLVQLL